MCWLLYSVVLNGFNHFLWPLWYRNHCVSTPRDFTGRNIPFFIECLIIYSVTLWILKTLFANIGKSLNTLHRSGCPIFPSEQVHKIFWILYTFQNNTVTLFCDYSNHLNLLNIANNPILVVATLPWWGEENE